MVGNFHFDLMSLLKLFMVHKESNCNLFCDCCIDTITIHKVIGYNLTEFTASIRYQNIIHYLILGSVCIHSKGDQAVKINNTNMIQSHSYNDDYIRHDNELKILEFLGYSSMTIKIIHNYFNIVIMQCNMFNRALSIYILYTINIAHITFIIFNITFDVNTHDVVDTTYTKLCNNIFDKCIKSSIMWTLTDKGYNDSIYFRR